MKSEIKPTATNERDSAESSNPSQEFQQPNRLARRSFLRNLGMGAALLALGAALLGNASKALGGLGDRRHLPDGDVAILQLLAAVELIEEDLWQQYNELGGSRRARFRVQGRTRDSGWGPAPVYCRQHG